MEPQKLIWPTPEFPMPKGAIATDNPLWGRLGIALACVTGNLVTIEDSLEEKLLAKLMLHA